MVHLMLQIKMFRPVRSLQTTDLSGFTCLMPTVSIGNVGQLSLDLIIATLPCEQIGSIVHKAVVPLFGRNALRKSSRKPTTAIDVFVCKEHKLLLIQVRSSVVKRYRHCFVEDLYSWLSSKKVSQLLVLSSLDAVERQDKAIASPDQIYFKVPDLKLDSNQINDLKATGAREFTEPSCAEFPLDDSDTYLGSGFLPSLLNNSAKLEGNVTAIFLYCLEGDNRPQGFLLASFAMKLLGISNENKVDLRLKSPHSWAVLDEQIESHLTMF